MLMLFLLLLALSKQLLLLDVVFQWIIGWKWNGLG
jgi:hypothetical protein